MMSSTPSGSVSTAENVTLSPVVIDETLVPNDRKLGPPGSVTSPPAPAPVCDPTMPPPPALCVLDTVGSPLPPSPPSPWSPPPFLPFEEEGDEPEDKHAAVRARTRGTSDRFMA